MEKDREDNPENGCVPFADFFTYCWLNTHTPRSAIYH